FYAARETGFGFGGARACEGFSPSYERLRFEVDALEVGGGDLERIEEQSRALQLDAIFEQGAADFHHRDLDGIRVLERRQRAGRTLALATVSHEHRGYVCDP